MIIGLSVIIALVLIAPVMIHKVERNLELFLLLMGILSVSIAHWLGPQQLWSGHLVHEALREPVMITTMVLAIGIIVHFAKEYITRAIVSVEQTLGSKVFCFMLVTGLGLAASLITAIMAAIILVEVVDSLKFKRRFEVRLVILGCFSIGLGAVLTPVGEPLSTIAVSTLRGAPFHADFFFLFRHLGMYVIPGVFLLGALSAVLEPSVKQGARHGLREKQRERISGVIIMAGKVYLFITALVLLGAGFKPFVDAYIVTLPGWALYWINTLSAVMDNATLTAAEISPAMTLPQIRFILMGLLLSGGMLIPGNIPNIIAAGRLNISSREWARLGVPLGLSLMLVYFILFVLRGNA